MASKHEILRRKIYRYALTCGARGITTDEIAHVFGTVPNCVSGRLTELKRDDFLIPTSRKRVTRRGKWAIVCLANPRFRSLLKVWDMGDKIGN